MWRSGAGKDSQAQIILSLFHPQSNVFPFFFFFFWCKGALWGCFCLNEHKIQSLFITRANCSWQDIALSVSFWWAGLLIRASFAIVISEHLAFACYVAYLLDAGKYEIGSLKGSRIIFDVNIYLKKLWTEKGVCSTVSHELSRLVYILICKRYSLTPV